MRKIRQNSHIVAKKTLRKPSANRSKLSTRQKWWKFGFSESSLTKTKLLFGVLIGIVALISGILTTLRIYANDEATFRRYADRIEAWHFKTKLWNGYFSNWEEGIVNLVELNLSDSTMALALQTTGRTIDGGMSEKTLCEIAPPSDFKLLRGTISHFGNSADIQIFEFVGGRTKIYAEFSLHHDGLVLEVSPKRNSRWLGTDTTRLIQHSDSTIDSGFEKMKGFCSEEEAKFRAMLRKSIDQVLKEKKSKLNDSKTTSP